MSRNFDLTTHRRNKKGAIISETPYTLHVDNGQRKFERPPGSGIMYAENGELISQPKKHTVALSEKAKKELQALAEQEMQADDETGGD